MNRLDELKKQPYIYRIVSHVQRHKFDLLVEGFVEKKSMCFLSVRPLKIEDYAHLEQTAHLASRVSPTKFHQFASGDLSYIIVRDPRIQVGAIIMIVSDETKT